MTTYGPMEFQSPPPWATLGSANVLWRFSCHYCLLSLHHISHLRNSSLLWVLRHSQPQPPTKIWKLSHKCRRDASIIRVESSIDHNFWPLFLPAPVVNGMPISSIFTGFHGYTISMIQHDPCSLATCSDSHQNEDYNLTTLQWWNWWSHAARFCYDPGVSNLDGPMRLVVQHVSWSSWLHWYCRCYMNCEDMFCSLAVLPAMPSHSGHRNCGLPSFSSPAAW